MQRFKQGSDVNVDVRGKRAQACNLSARLFNIPKLV